MKNYNLNIADRLRFTSLVILNEMVQFQHYFPVELTGDDSYLATYLDHMEKKGVVRVDNDKYVPTEMGREEIVALYTKYQEYLKIFDIFCAVDLERGEFAFSSITNPEMDNDDVWFEFLEQERFSDVRVAVADFKGINPIEIVFLAFLNEGRFNCNEPKWQFDLTGDDVWLEIEEICNTAVSKDYLMTDGVLEDVIREGSKLALEIISEAEAAKLVEEEEVYETTTTTETVEEYVDVVEEPYYPYDYYYPYYDPFYVSPVWVAAAIVLW